MARLGVIGLWHLGCVAAAALARLGHTVRATDFDSDVVRGLEQGRPPIFEPGLAELIAEQRRAGRLAFLTSCAEACAGSEQIFITFDTPVDEDDRSDLTPIHRAIEEIARHASAGVQVVVMSQVPAGTCRQLAEWLRSRAPQLSSSLVYHPENLRPGEALRTFLQPDFLLVGASDAHAATRLLGLYDGVAAPRLTMNWSSAEMAKHALNAFLATSISFVNELADLAEACGADLREVTRALRHDRRIGPHAFLNPGPGFSGGTLGRDIQTLRQLGEQAGRRTLQLDATLAVNAARLPALVEKTQRACGGLTGRQIGLLGLTYKPGTNTLRRSHALALARLLREAGAQVRAFDPQVMQARPETEGIALCSDPYQAAEHGDALLVITPWPEFKALDLARLHRVMRQPVLIDAHNLLDDQAARGAGFRYFGAEIAGEQPLRGGCNEPVRLDGETALITGAGRGIGEAIANAFARAGANVALMARTAVEVERVAQQATRHEVRAVAVVGDVRQRPDVTRLVMTAQKEFGRIDVLVNAAGIYGPIGPLVENDLDTWAEAIEINLLGTVYCVHAVLPHMLARRKGVIVNLSGGGAVSPFPRFSAYSSSKAAIVRLTETVAEEVKDSGVRVNAIAPGAVNTRLLDQVLAAGERAGEEFYAKALQQKNNGGTPPERAAELAVFLASPAAAGVTGRLISAVWDDWKSLPHRVQELGRSALFTLRRIDGRHFTEVPR